MTDRLNVTATLSAVDMASPVIDRFMQNVRKLENSVKRLNRSFDTLKGIGKGSPDLANPYQKLFNDMDRSVKDQIAGARRYSASWRQAHDERIRSEQRLHASLSRLESDAFARRERHQAALARQHSHAGAGYRSAARSRSADDAFINGAAGAFVGSRFSSGGALAVGAGIGLAVKEAMQQRMKTDAAETKAQIFGELSKDDVAKLRSGWADKASLRFGVPINEIISTYNEGLKAGVTKGRVAEQFTENILKAKTGLELGTDVTAKIAARIATISSGLKNSFDPAFTYRFLNAIAVVAKETAADPDEIVEANKRGISVLTSSRMSVEDLSAFTAAGVDAGLQPGKAGTFLGFSVSELINAKNARGQRSKDLEKGSRMLGFSGRGDISRQMANAPTETLLKVYDALQAMTEENRVKAADLVFMREWRDEALANSKKADDIRKSIAAVRKSPGFIDTTSIQKLSSLQGRWDRHIAQFTLAMDRIGAGFETILIPVSNVLLWIGDHLNFDLIASGVKNALTGNLPMLMLDLIKGVWGLILDFAKEAASSVFGSILGKKDKGGSPDRPHLRKQSLLAPAEDAAKAFKKVAFDDNETKSSIDALRDQLRSIGADIRLASYSGATEFSARRQSSESFSGAGLAARNSFEASPRALANNAPGNPLPAFGMSRSGIIHNGRSKFFDKNAVPSFTGGGGSVADNVGAGLTGNAFLAARRARFAEELKNDPALRMHLAAMQATEGTSKGGTIESLMNRADMQGKTMREMLGFSAEGRINPRSFYGPIRRGEIFGAIRRLQNSPKEFAKYDAFTSRALAGSHVIGGYTDQGLATDPNGSARTGIKGFKISPKDGNEFTDWVGPGSRWGRGRAGAMNYRKFIEENISKTPDSLVRNVPETGQSIIQKVPQGGGASGGGMLPFAMNGGAQININGGSHDPETLATLVQRRINESMNWRTHDIEAEMT
ncbi:phage tail tape measure protein [Bradyrhizobium sp. G127]|uniref:phage tail tape measure protein n=1 Tax=Bradyrhizobium sp. G127 TaxID=2904800 RepID=UPI001F388717|nr:phage tail tape measure protein [Bradyrhizobium sp. G127]MCF2522401.1 phage tail tape measure protein [Bradyrhizobium sp. G127]